MEDNNSKLSDEIKYFDISIFNKTTDVEPKHKLLTWQELCNRIEQPFIRTAKDGKGFSAAVFEGNRLKENVKEISMIIFDIDHKTNLDTIINRTKKLNCTFAVYSTHSHKRKTKENPNSEPRFRLVIPLKENVSKDEFERFWESVSAYLEINVDESTKDAGRMFFSPCKVNNNADYDYYIEDASEIFDSRKWLAENEEYYLAKQVLKTTFPIGEFPEWYKRLQEEIKLIGHQKKRGIEFKCPNCGESSNSSAILFNNGAVYCRKPTHCKAIEMARALGIDTKTNSLNSPVSPNSLFAPTQSNRDLKSFPVLNDKALIGVAGELVKTIFPHTESDKAALLIQFLIGVGNLIGRNAYFEADGQHYTNLYGLLVGGTSSAKGSSLSQVKRILREVDNEWFSNQVKTGISSGEGLINSVNDETSVDKRLLVTEPEFAAVLKRMKQETNTAGTVMRTFFDDGTAATLTKNTPLSTTDAHVSIIGHITPEDLERFLTDTDTGNGFANRFMFVCVKRSKSLPEGGSISESEQTHLVSLFKKVLEFVNKQNGEFEMKRDEEARELWSSIYEKLSEERSGVFGKITVRGRVFVTRLACIYALLNCSKIVSRTHLEAGLAVWQYCEQSAAYIFGKDNSLSTDARKLLADFHKVGDKGLNRTEISAVFNRKRSKEKLDSMLNELKDFLTFDETQERYFAVEVNRANGESGELGESEFKPLYLSTSLYDQIFERAAILEYDDNLPRDEAFNLANFLPVKTKPEMVRVVTLIPVETNIN